MNVVRNIEATCASALPTHSRSSWGPHKNARRTRSDRSTAREIRTLLAAKEYKNQQHKQLDSTTFRGPTPSATRSSRSLVNARVRQLKRTELAWRVESAQCLRLFSRSLNSCRRSYDRRSLSNVHRTFFTRKNHRFSGAPNARIVRRSRSFDRREIRTSCRDKGAI